MRPARSRRIVGALLGAALLVTGAAASGQTAPLSPAQRSAYAVAEAYDRKDCARVLALGVPLVDAAPSPLPDPLLSKIYDLVLSCEVQRGPSPATRARLLRATARADSSDFAWRLRFLAAAADEDYADAVATVEAMTQGRGAALNSIPIAWIWEVRGKLDRPETDALETRLLKVMADPAYQPDGPDSALDDSGSQARVLYAKKLAAQGNAAAARQLLRDVTGLSPALGLNFTPTLRALHPEPIDLRAVVEADLVRHRAIADIHPDSLRAINAVALDLRRLGRAREAIASLEANRASVEKRAFADQDEGLPWWWDGLAQSYAAVGDYDAAVRAFRGGAAVAERGGTNVSQVINFAELELSYGHYAAVLSGLATFDRPGITASPFGMMQVYGDRGCAMALSGDSVGAAKAAAWAIAHEADDPKVVTTLALCRGDADAAAASYLRRLANPKWQLRALLELAGL